MKTSLKRNIIIFAVLTLGVLAAGIWYLSTADIAVLQPEGSVAEREKQLILFAFGLSLVVVVPVFMMTFWFAWRYREGNKNGHAKYAPNMAGNKLYETVWWLVPAILILILSVVTWRSSHELDPYKPLVSDKKALEIQVVAMQWKWLFIYPEQGIATVNYLQVPEKTPLNFTITSDGPMNSFWVPKLGGQIYAMSGMSSKLHLIADKPGTYEGSSANISGRGFADMRFDTKVTSQAEFDSWVTKIQASDDMLTVSGFAELAKQTKNHPVQYFVLGDKDLYDTIEGAYMSMPQKTEGSY
ncbi:MAG TPA: ubiquinol oxidase subunit II [Candidatus Saccharimonadales bacterium]|nr:ubiquinol oxidase subunit II [Candidatus Saccharimonadales bacterium]